MAFNGNNKTKDYSLGIFQINLYGRLKKARLEQYDLTNEEDLYNPLTNAKIAYAISSEGRNWYPWGAFTNGSFLKYYEE